MGAGDLDLSVRFLFTFGDFLAVRIPEPDKMWKFDVRRDLGIYLGDADDTKRGYLVYMLPSGSVKVRADCIKLDVSEDVLLSNAGVCMRFLEKTSPIQRVRDAKIVFEESVNDSSESNKVCFLRYYSKT